MTKLTNCLLSKEASESYSLRSPELIFPEQKLTTAESLRDAVDKHLALERASFHTPGHKGRVSQASAALTVQYDVTELPGLDDLSHPQGVLAKLSKKASAIWNTQSSLISVNGASACLVAAILSVEARGKKLLVPRNAHRAIVTGLVMSGLEPCWYSPEWNAEWHVFDEVTSSTIQSQIEREGAELAAVVVVSPTYAGAMSDMESIATICKKAGIALIVDEAHGAQLFQGTARAASAVECGADIVVHSLHKTLGAMTQTGLLHLPFGSSVNEQEIAFHLNMMQSTSPSYPLLLSVEEALTQVSNIKLVTELAQSLRNEIIFLENFKVYDTACGTEFWHLLIQPIKQSSSDLYDYLVKNGIYAECQMGTGVLLMLGIGTTQEDLNLLLDALKSFSSSVVSDSENLANRVDTFPLESAPPNIEQVMSPRLAAMAPSHSVPLLQAENLIASECIAPCPPGIPLCVPGQRLTKDVLNKITKEQVRVVNEHFDDHVLYKT